MPTASLALFVRPDRLPRHHAVDVEHHPREHEATTPYPASFSKRSTSGAAVLPPKISTAFQIPDPRKVNRQKRHSFMCASPAGSETMVRRIGENRSAKTMPSPYLRKMSRAW